MDSWLEATFQAMFDGSKPVSVEPVEGDAGAVKGEVISLQSLRELEGNRDEGTCCRP